MKIISWNCNMCFRKKAECVLSLNPDILVISECESKDKIDLGKFNIIDSNAIWIGTNPNKGLLIASCNPRIKITTNESYVDKFQYILPLDVRFEDEEFTLIGVWTQKTETIYTSYVVQAYRAIFHYADLISDKTFLIGDFNSSSIWDGKDKKEATHSDLVNELKAKKIESVFHWKNGLSSGNESCNTLYFRKKRESGYHIDYIFVGEFWMSKLTNLEIGEFENWIKLSDHMPIIAEFNTN